MLKYDTYVMHLTRIIIFYMQFNSTVCLVHSHLSHNKLLVNTYKFFLAF